MDDLNTTSGSTTTGPTSFSDTSLTWSDAPSASDPIPDSPVTDTPPASATETPATEATETGQPQQGEPPQERWADILANTRAKEREAALSEWRQKHGWAEQVNPQEFQQVAEMAKRASADPIGYLTDFIKELQGSPEHAAQLRSLAARALAQRSGAPAEQEPQPDLPIQLEDGRVVHLYSAEQQAKREAFLQQRWLQSVEQKLQPLQQSYEQQQEAAKAYAAQQDRLTYANQTAETAAKWKGMSDPVFRQRVTERLAQMQVNGDDKRDVSLALHDAYLAVRDENDQTATQKAQSQLLDNLQRKAAASTSVNPGSAAASTPKRVDRFDQLPKEAWS